MKYNLINSSDFTIIPSETTELGFLGLLFNERMGYGSLLKAFLTPLPYNLLSLDLSYHSFQVEDLAFIFKTLPRTLTSLSLDSTYLGKQPKDPYAKSFYIFGLFYSKNRFQFAKRQSIDLLINSFRNLPNLRFLNLRYCWLDKLEGNIVSFFKALPRTLISLNIKNNDLHLIEVDDLRAAFHFLPQGLESISLSFDIAHFERQIFIFRVLNYLPKSIKRLSLEINNSDFFHNLFNWALFFKILPKQLTDLSLTTNLRFWNKATDLQAGFRALSLGLMSLSLNYQNLRYMSIADLIEIFRDLPLTLRSLNLSGTYFKRSIIDKIIPFTVEEIILSKNKIINRSYSWAKKLQKQLLVCLSQSDTVQQISFSNIHIDREIDETLLNKLISHLESEDTPLALFTAALLLEGQIPTIYDRDVDYLASYMEKRTQDAISFYLKALQKSDSDSLFIKPAINFFLWEMRTTTEFPSVQSRLALLDLELPTDYLPSLNRYVAPSHVIKMLFFQPLPSKAYQDMGQTQREFHLQMRQ